MPRGAFTKMPDALTVYRECGRGAWGLRPTKKGHLRLMPLDVPSDLTFAANSKRGQLLALRIADLALDALKELSGGLDAACNGSTPAERQEILAESRKRLSALDADLRPFFMAAKQ